VVDLPAANEEVASELHFDWQAVQQWLLAAVAANHEGKAIYAGEVQAVEGISCGQGSQTSSSEVLDRA
jgi:hypothetical protein